MASLMAWLADPWMGDVPVTYPIPGVEGTPTRLQVLACLIGINGGIDVGGWGVISSGGPYGRSGLDQTEGLALIQLGSFVRGWMAGTDLVNDQALTDALQAEWNRVGDLAAKERGSDDNTGG
jgi:hypothetical protein